MRMISYTTCFIIVVAATIFLGPTNVQSAELKNLKATALESTDVLSLPKTASGNVSIIVKFDVDSLSAYRGGVNGMPATSPQVTGARRLDMNSPNVKAYESFLAQKERTFEAAVRSAIPGTKIVHRYRKIIAGVSMIVPADRVKEIAKLPGVKAVYPDELLALNTDRSPEFIGAPVLWSQVGGQSSAGEGSIVGVIDTGIWPEHPSVADNGMPAPPDDWNGTLCEFGSSTPNDSPFSCNNKLIGASRHMDTFDSVGPAPLPGEFFSARDNNGHGSHTATTAAGNADVLATTGTLVTGIAPRAHVAVYKVCFTNAAGQGSCFTSDSVAAIEQGIDDGVHVMNFSIAGGINPYSDIVSLAFLDAYNAGVFVAASAGNTGPGANTVNHREPWVTTVAALTTDKGFNGSADLSADGGASLTVTGASSTTDLDNPASVVLAADFEDGVDGGGPTCPGIAEGESDALCCNPFPPNTFSGQIVVCKRGTNARVSKSFNVAAGGAGGMILYNPVPGSLNPDVHAVPSVHIDEVQGASLLAFLAANANETGTITGGANDLSGQGDVMAGFSSRGGTGQTLGINKPDVGAPGVNILAANTPFPAAPGLPLGQFFQIISGTSMSSPHVAGAAAVIRQLHPNWSPGQIKSALMMTATTENTVKEDAVTPTDPFDIGSGRIDLTTVGNPGLTISETGENFILLQGNLSTANYPSLYIPVLAGIARVERTLKSVESQARNWQIDAEGPADLRITVIPDRFRLRGGHSKDINIIVDASRVPIGETRHALLRLTSHHGSSNKELTFPVTVVRRQGGVTLNKTCDPLIFPKGQDTTCTIEFTNNTFEDQDVTVIDLVPRQLDVEGVTGAFRLGNLVFFNGTLDAATPPTVEVDSRAAEFGYIPLSAFGIPPIGNMNDESAANFNVPPFLYAGTTYTSVGVVSNGYVVVGGATGADIQFVNQQLPNPAVPNNVLAPFWSDLNPANVGGGGDVRIGVLSDGVNDWVVVDWENVINFGQPAQTNSFQVWIGVNGVQDIFYTYGPTTTGADGLLTVGAENNLGNSGENYYFNGTGTLPAPTTEVVVGGAPASPGETHIITIDAEGDKKGTWRNCAEMFTDAIFGIATSCVDGEVTKN